MPEERIEPPPFNSDDEPCMCGTEFTCLAHHPDWVRRGAGIEPPSDSICEACASDDHHECSVDDCSCPCGIGPPSDFSHPHEGPINHRRLLWKYLVHVGVFEATAYVQPDQRSMSSPLIQWFTDDEWAELQHLDRTEVYGDA